ncbi:hypothetical protein N7508_000676, partial [Penicillium antarcticum]|uniref:uncharacterized protein n=1 Tax=Penicillium antarcticum TaxID=416450 RepID=UPI00238E3743
MDSTYLSAMRSETLKNSSQWRSWHNRMKAFALQRLVWDLCNSAIEKAKLPTPLLEPIVPEYSETGDQDEKARWRDLFEVYKIEAIRWKRQRKGLLERFANSRALEEEIRMKWRAFPSQKPTGDVDEWVTLWEEMYEQAASLKSSDVASANKDFLQAIKEVLPTWWQANYQQII